MKGRLFFDLNATRNALKEYPDVQDADACLAYNAATNEMTLFADVKADADFDTAACLSTLGEKLAPNNVPVALRVV